LCRGEAFGMRILLRPPTAARLPPPPTAEAALTFLRRGLSTSCMGWAHREGVRLSTASLPRLVSLNGPAIVRKVAAPARSGCRQLCKNAKETASTAGEAASKAAAEGAAAASGGFSYVAFAKANPVANNLIIATIKTGAADLMAQMVIERKPFNEVDWQRNFVFCLFGAAYLGMFQYWYQVNIFKRIFPSVERFTNQSWAAKLQDGPGLVALGGQIGLDLGMLCFVYLPAFYTFKAAVFSSTYDVTEWVKTGTTSYTKNFQKDAYDVIRVWGPADVCCFSVPLYLRLPVRHIVSFVWTVYLSFVRGSK